MALLRADNTNFENGITNRNAANLFGSMHQLDPTRFHSIMDDFDEFRTADYDVTGAGAGTVEITDGLGGILTLTTAGADDDAENIQRAGGTNLGAGYRLDGSTPVYFRCRFNVDDATESDVVAGLQSIVADPHVPAEGLVFVKADGGTVIRIDSVVGSAVVATANLAAPLVASTFITLEIYYDGIDRFYFGANGTPGGFITAVGGTTREVTPTFGVQAGQAAVLVSELDYLFSAQFRD